MHSLLVQQTDRSRQRMKRTSLRKTRLRWQWEETQEEGGGSSQWAADRQDEYADSAQCRAADRGRCTAAACRLRGTLAQTGPLFRERRCEERSANAPGSQ